MEHLASLNLNKIKLLKPADLRSAKQVLREWAATALVLIFFIIPFQTTAAILVLSPNQRTVGEDQYTFSEGGETLAEIGRRFDMGYREMVNANQKLNTTRPLPAGIQVIIPSKFQLPDVAHKGIVINLAQFRLYYFPPDENVVITCPVGIGRKGWSTPLGVTKIIAKQINPVWRPTENIQAAAAEHGMLLPDEFPSGEDNPLGKHALRLGWTSYLLHGTQRPEGVGSRVSAGCLRLYPEDIEHLYEIVKIGTPVRIINAS